MRASGGVIADRTTAFSAGAIARALLRLSLTRP
jgi:hypothetical protein